MKTARFSQVVAKAGRPSVHLLWTAPAKDKALQQAVHAGRVMTIHLEPRGTKAGFGQIGLPEGDEKTQVLVFPKSLKAFAGDRIVGIDYDLIEQGLVSGTDPGDVPRSAKPAKAVPAAVKAPPPEPLPVSPPVENEPLLKVIRAAMKDLKRGNAVAAYKRLANAAG